MDEKNLEAMALAFTSALSEVAVMVELGIPGENESPEIAAERTIIRREQNFAGEKDKGVVKTFVRFLDEVWYRVDFSVAKKLYDKGEFIAMLPAFAGFLLPALPPWPVKKGDDKPFEFYAQKFLKEVCESICEKRLGRPAFFVSRKNWERRNKL